VAYHLVLVGDYSSDVECSAVRVEEGVRVRCDVRVLEKEEWLKNIYGNLNGRRIQKFLPIPWPVRFMPPPTH
jgi:hypothetical protein